MQDRNDSMEQLFSVLWHGSVDPYDWRRRLSTASGATSLHSSTVRRRTTGRLSQGLLSPPNPGSKSGASWPPTLLSDSNHPFGLVVKGETSPVKRGSILSTSLTKHFLSISHWVQAATTRV